MSTKSYATFLVTILLTWIAIPPLLADNSASAVYDPPKLLMAQNSEQFTDSQTTRQTRSQPDTPGKSCDHKGNGDPNHCNDSGSAPATTETTTPVESSAPTPQPEPVTSTPPTPTPEPAPVTTTPVTTTPAPAPVTTTPVTAAPVTTTPEPVPVTTTPESKPVVTTTPESKPVVTTTPEPTPVITTTPEPAPVTTTAEPVVESPPITTTPEPEPVVESPPVTITPEPVVQSPPESEPVTTISAPAPAPVVESPPVVTTIPEPAPESSSVTITAPEASEPPSPPVAAEPVVSPTPVVVTPTPVVEPQPELPVAAPQPESPLAPVTILPLPTVEETLPPVVEPLIPPTASICPKTGILTETCVGQQQTLTDVTINPGVSISQVTLAGTILNQGWISNATILPTATVTGGTLTGTINNQGILSDITFRGSLLDGGSLSGTVMVQKGAKLEQVTLLPNTSVTGGSLINVQVLDGVQLSHLVIGAGTQLSQAAIIGPAVRFTDNHQVPVGANLTAAFATLFSSELPLLLDLQTEILSGPVPTLLQQLNQLPELQNNQWQFEQNPFNGQLQLTMEGIRFALLPVSVTQVGTDQPVGMTINPDDSIRFITSYGREILAQPMIQDMEAFRQALGLAPKEVQVTKDGVVYVNTGENSKNAYRPSVESNLVGSEQPTGLFDAPDQLNAKKLVFLDETGQTREQLIHSACAYPQQWQAYQDSLPKGTNDLVLGQDGTVSVSIDGQRYRGVCDSTVTTTQESSESAKAKGTKNSLLSFVTAKDGKGLVVSAYVSYWGTAEFNTGKIR